MKYELAHDTLAKQIFLKSSDASKTRRRLKAMVEREYQRHMDNKLILLSRPDLLEIRILGKAIKFTAEEEEFIRRSWRRVRLKQTITIVLISIAFVILAIFYGYANLQRMTAEKSEEKAKAVALASKAVEYQLTGDDTKALRFSQYSFQTQEIPATKRALYTNFYKRKKFFYSISQAAHQYDITHAVFSPVEPYQLVTTSLDGTAKIWKEDFSSAIDTINLWEKLGAKTLPGIHCANFSKDGQQIIFATEDSSAVIYNRYDRKIAKTLKHDDWVRMAKFSPINKNEVLTITNKGMAFRCNVATEKKESIPSSYPIKSADYSFDGRFICNSIPGYIEIRSQRGKLIQQVALDSETLGSRPTLQVQFLSQKIGGFYGILATNTRNSYTKIYIFKPSSIAPQDAKGILNPLYEKITEVLDKQRYVSVGTIHSNNFLATINADQIVKIWDAKNFQSGLRELGTISGHIVEVVGVAFHPKEKQLVTYSRDRTFKVWDFSNEEILFDQIVGNIQDKVDFKEPAIINTLGNGNIISIASTPYPEFMETDDQADFYLYNLEMGKVLNKLPFSGNLPVADVSSTADLIAMSVSPHFNFENGPKAGEEYGHIRMITKTGVQIQSFRGHQAPITALNFSKSGTLILTADYDGFLKIWDLKNDGALLKEASLGRKIVDARMLPGDSTKILVTTKDDFDYLRLYDWDGQLIQSTHPNSQYAPPKPPSVVRKDDHYLVLTYNYDKAELFKLTMDTIALMDNFYSYDESIFSAALSGNGEFVILNDENQAKYIALQGPERILSTLENVHAAQFSQNGAYVFVIDKERQAIERWPWSPDTLIQRIERLNISDLKKEYEQVVNTIQ